MPDPQEDSQMRDIELWAWELALATSRNSGGYKAAKAKRMLFAGPCRTFEPRASKIANIRATSSDLCPLGLLADGTPVKWNGRHDTITQAPT